MQLALYGLLHKDNLLGINSPSGFVQKQGLRIKIGGLYRGSSYQREADSSVNLPCIETVAGESCPLFILLRHRTPSSPIFPSEEIRTPFALSRVFFLSSGGESVLLVKEKVLSLSGILLSMHVVLKTRHANPNIHVRRY